MKPTTMKCFFGGLAALALAGCTSTAMAQAADRDEARAEVRAQLGDGYNAALLKQRAADLRANAELRQELHGHLWSEVTLD